MSTCTREIDRERTTPISAVWAKPASAADTSPEPASHSPPLQTEWAEASAWAQMTPHFAVPRSKNTSRKGKEAPERHTRQWHPLTANRHSQRAHAGRQLIHSRLQEAAAESSPMGFSVNVTHLDNLADAQAAAVERGIPFNSRRQADRAWQLWVQVCKMHGTSPICARHQKCETIRRGTYISSLSTNAAGGSHIQVNELDKISAIKPATAMAYPLAIIRIFKYWGAVMPKASQLKPHIRIS